MRPTPKQAMIGESDGNRMTGRTTKCSMSLRLQNMKTQIFVMPAWIAGIHRFHINQVRTDASGNIHVNLDSSTPCWNDAREGPLLNVTEALRPLFQRRGI
jgi:hypothetical protein